MTKYDKEGTEIWISREPETSTKDLPPGTYTITHNPLRGFYLQKVEDFSLEGKVYGIVPRQVERITNTFFDRKVSTGVILQGEKGSGKTYLAKLLSIELLQKGISTLIVNVPYHGEAFNEFLGKIDTPCMILFDEFEKMYDYSNQDKLLTLFDGTNTGAKKLWIVTLNNGFRLTEFVKNRPGRFLYSLSYKGLEPEFIIEYCKDNLKDQDQIRPLLVFSNTFAQFNFDILKALVEEMNRYNEPVIEAIKYLNATPHEQACRYKVESVEFNKESFKTAEYDEYACGGNPYNPFQADGWIELRAKVADPKDVAKRQRHKKVRELLKSGAVSAGFMDDEDDYQEFTWEPSDLYDISDDKYSFQNAQGKIVLKKEEVKPKFTVEHMLMKIGPASE